MSNESTATIEQLYAVGQVLVSGQINLERINKKRLQDVIVDRAKLIRNLELFLANGAQVLIGEPKVIQIDRSTSFNPATFIGAGWTIWKGPKDGKGLEGEEEQDARSLTLTEVDLSQVLFQDCLRVNESYHTGEECLTRFIAQGDIRLDAAIFHYLWQNQHLIPAPWKEPINGNTRYVFFDGTTLRNSDSRRCTLYLFWHDDRWRWRVDWLNRNRRANYPSVLLASSAVASDWCSLLGRYDAGYDSILRVFKGW